MHLRSIVHTLQAYFREKTCQLWFSHSLFQGNHFVKWRPYRTRANGNIVYLIASAISFPKMCSFHTLCYLKAEIMMETCFKAAILYNGGHVGLGENGNIVSMIAFAISFPKMYSFPTLCYLKAEILTKPEFKAAIL